MGWLKNIFKESGERDIKESHVKVFPYNGTSDDYRKYIKENGEIIAESCRLIEEIKTEYQAVTSYLKDIQKIEMIPKAQRDELEDAARNIINLSKEREMIKKMRLGITDTQYRLFEQYEMQIPKELTAVKEAENYQVRIDEDLKKLEEEKKNFLNEKNEIASNQLFLKGIAIATCIIIIVFFVIFAILYIRTQSNMTLPFLLTVLMGMASGLYIFMEARKNTTDIQLLHIKLNKVIMLANKVTIKSVNNQNYMDYIYNKYMVDNYEHFKECWEQFLKIKEENKRYKNNTLLLEFYYEKLIKELKRFGISDAEIWIYQPSAILDSREMVEIRHRLNARRQKLRERIDIYQKQKDEAVKTITSLIKVYPESREEAIHILNRYNAG